MASTVQINFKIGGADAVSRVFTSIIQASERAMRAQVRASQAATKAAGDDARKRVALELEAARQINRIHNDEHRHQLALIRDRTRAETRALAERQRAEQRAVEQRARAMRGVVGGVVSGGADGVRTLGRGVGGAVRLAAGVGGSLMAGAGVEVGLARAVRQRAALERRAVDLSNAAYQEQGVGIQTQRVDPRALMGQAQALGAANAIDPEKALEGLSKFTAVTGDLATGRALLGDLTKLARATGANLEDVVATAGEISKSMGDAATSEEEATAKARTLFQMMKGVAGQTKLGSVEMADLSKHGARLAAAASQFEGGTGENLLRMGALAQEARGGGGAWTAATAAGSVTGLVNTFKTPARQRQFDALGIKLEGQGGKLRNPFEILSEAIDKTGGDMRQLQPMFANIVGGRALAGLTNKYLEGSKGGKDDASKAAGRAALQAELQRMTKGAAMSDAEVNESAARSMNTMEAKAQKFQQRIDQIAGDLADKLIPAFLQLTPVIEKAVPILGRFVDELVKNGPALAAALDRLVPRVAEAADALAKLIGFAIEHPYLTGAAVVGGGALQGGASALMSGAATALMSSATPLAAAGAALKTSASVLGVAGAALAGVAAGMAIADDMDKEAKKKRNEVDSRVSEATNLAHRIRTGRATPEEMARAQGLQGQLEETAGQGALGRFWEGLTAGGRGLLNGDVTAANFVSMLPIVGAARGGIEAVTGGGERAAAAGGAEELKAALAGASMKLDPSASVQIGNAEAIGAAVASAVAPLVSNSAYMNGPKAQGVD